MPKLKNITNSPLSLQVFRTLTPVVNGVSQDTVLHLRPKEEVDETLWLVADINSASYNEDLILGYVAKNYLTRLA